MMGPYRTRADNYRFHEIQDRGCVPCFLEARITGREWVPQPCDMHHVIQDDHQMTYGNCPWHHRGVAHSWSNSWEMKLNFGPSMAIEPKKYRERYGSEAELLALQNKMLLQSVPSLMRVADGSRKRQDHPRF